MPRLERPPQSGNRMLDTVASWRAQWLGLRDMSVPVPSWGLEVTGVNLQRHRPEGVRPGPKGGTCGAVGKD